MLTKVDFGQGHSLYYPAECPKTPVVRAFMDKTICPPFFPMRLLIFNNYNSQHSMMLLGPWVGGACRLILGIRIYSLPPISWSLQHITAFNSTVSCKGFSEGSPCRDTPSTYQTSVAFPNHEGGFQTAFFVSLSLKPASHGPNCHILLLARAGTWPLVQINFHQLFAFAA